MGAKSQGKIISAEGGAFGTMNEICGIYRGYKIYIEGKKYHAVVNEYPDSVLVRDTPEEIKGAVDDYLVVVKEKVVQILVCKCIKCKKILWKLYNVPLSAAERAELKRYKLWNFFGKKYYFEYFTEKVKLDIRGEGVEKI